MEAKARRAMLDGLVVTGWTFIAMSLTLPWAESQTCGPMSECGPWLTRSGWDEFGLPAVIAGTAAAAGAWVAWGIGRRVVPLVVVGLLGAGYLVWLAWFDFAIFQEVRGPLAGAWLAAAGILLAVVAGAASLLRSPPPAAAEPADP